MQYEDELYAERLRREAQAAALAAGEASWSNELGQPARVKLRLAWLDAVKHCSTDEVGYMPTLIEEEGPLIFGRIPHA